MSPQPYRASLVDLGYYLDNIPCRRACPISTNAAGYIGAIAAKDYERAYDIARAPNPLVYTLGRVCGHPCETACRRGKLDEPIAICGLKRHATDYHNLGLGHDSGLPAARARSDAPKVAVVGSGPTGLAVAHDLARLGYRVTIFESAPLAGGMLQLGLPVYRLSRDIIKLEIDAILKLGVELRLNQHLGTDFNLADLRAQGFEAIFLGIGAHKSRELRIPGVELDGVLRGVDFLLNMNLGYKVNLGRRVIVIGGGNVAIDVARTAARYRQEEEFYEATHTLEEMIQATRSLIRQRGEEDFLAAAEAMHEAVDMARSALRLGAANVTMACLEARHEMPASEEEIHEALNEGVKVIPSRGPQRIIGSDGKCIGLEVIQCSSVFDAQGRFNPSFVKGSEEFIPADSVILAIGQASDLSFIKPEDHLETSPRGTFVVDPETLATSAPGVFAGGDAAFGPRLIVHALADGQRAARAIDAYLRGKQTLSRRATMTPVAPRSTDDPYYTLSRAAMPTLSLDRRIGISEVDLGFPEADAVGEAARCLQCHVNTVFDGSKCILCGGCADVCPHYCLKIVPLGEITMEGAVGQAVEARFGISLQDLAGPTRDQRLAAIGSAILKDDTLCTRCGLCAQRCPTGAITMERLDLVETSVA